MNINHLVLMMGLLLTCVGGYFSIIGLATIFAGAYWSVVVMATTLELSKVVAASWIYRQWSIAPFLIRTYMVSAVAILVFITSMGIFGYLSKAHVEQTINQGGNNEIRIESLQRKIDRQNNIITDAEKVVAQLDEAVEILQNYDRIRGPDGALAVRAGQAEERQSLNESINEAYDEIEVLQEELIPLQKQQLELEAEIGPLKYIAELIYGENAASYFDVAVRWIIILLVSVFDPLAIVMIIAGNVGLSQRKKISPMTEEEVLKEVEIDWDHAPTKSREGHNLGG
jgi:chaperonin cofactor prefoldin